MSKPFTWSWSSLTSYELCPKKYYHENVARDFKLPDSDIQSYGIVSHKAFENRLLKGKPLPMDLQHHEGTMAKLGALPGTKLPEQKMAINRNFQPTGYFDADVYGRGIIDMGVVQPEVMLLIDWKFGKLQSGFGQLELMAAMMACYKPMIKKFIAMYYWAKEKRITQTVIWSDDLVKIWNKMIPRIQSFEVNVHNENFGPTPNYLCANYCPVKTCRFYKERHY